MRAAPKAVTDIRAAIRANVEVKLGSGAAWSGAEGRRVLGVAVGVAIC
ncbi:MAG TPA: hypothetical protein VGP92_01755 [Acidimicrobiia bacterium]|nr:hypothetical protein [Acidimicrobiia bacterium]